jgi:hypothetical protein
MSLERALIPIAIVVAVISLVVWLLLVNDVGIGPWLLAVLVFAHGWVHLLFVFPKPEREDGDASASEYPFDFGRSWLIRRAGLDVRLVQAVGLIVMGLTFAFSVLAALATVGLLVPAAWWAPLMVATAAVSATTLALFFSPALILGFGIDTLLVVLVITGSWSPAP